MQNDLHDNLPENADGKQTNELENEIQNSVTNAVENIENLNAEVDEHSDEQQTIEIQEKNYHSLTLDELFHELENLIQTNQIAAIKNYVEEIKTEFLAKYHLFIEEKREDFNQNSNSTEEFEYHLSVKSKFDSLYNQYKSKKAVYLKSLENSLKNNLQNRLALIEELKTLINPNENIKDSLKHFNELREKWNNAGPIPKDKYNHVWNNYHFHVENFYDYLHLDREARDLDFKHNLEAKQKLIARAENLLNELDTLKAFRELQSLHKIWKEEIGPVSKEFREDIWISFSEITKKMHDKREAIYEQFRASESENLETKNQIIFQIEALSVEQFSDHNLWQTQVEKINVLREQFFATGRVPNDVNEQTWSHFKEAIRNFNTHKNAFYKNLKNVQNTNLEKKQALVNKAIELQNSTDFEATTPIMKKIQEDWKHIGHVPRKFSDSIWKEFKAACNTYFERLNAVRNENESEEIEAFDKKKEYLENLKSFELIGDHKTDLAAIKTHIAAWKQIGKVPFARRHIEGKFNKVLDALFEKLSVSKKDSEMIRFSNKLDQLSEANDSKKIDNEKVFLIRKVEEVQHEIFQLENNIQFFANAKKDNPMVAEVRKNIERNKEDLALWKEKLKQIRNLK